MKEVKTMIFTEILTAIFVIFKLHGWCHWDWVWVLMPEIIAVTGYIGAIWWTLVMGHERNK